MRNLPNVLWITLDSVRQDHTTMSGYHRDTTPNIQRLAAHPSGEAADHCISMSRTSGLSVPSILSGLYPSQHGMYYTDQKSYPADLPTVAERFSNVGYRTMAVSNNTYMSEATNLDRGFEQFTLLRKDPKGLLETAGLKTTVKYLLNLRRHSAGISRNKTAHSGGYIITDIASRQLREHINDEEPFFMYIHYNETHSAYCPPLPYRDQFVDELSLSIDEAIELAQYVHHNPAEVIANGCDLSEEELTALKALYDAEIFYTDKLVGKLIDGLSNREETIIVVTADHGEAFGEWGMISHKYILHNCLINVPLVINGVDGLDLSGPVQHCDVMRTLLDIAGADTEDIMGVDLRSQSRRYAISQDTSHSMKELVSLNPEFEKNRYCTSRSTTVQDTKYKYLSCKSRSNLFRLPDECEDISEKRPSVAGAMADYLSTWGENHGTLVSGNPSDEVDEDLRRRLRDLGYLEEEI